MRLELYRFDGKHWFRLAGEDGLPLLVSRPHESRDDVLGSIERVRRDGARFVARENARGLAYFTVESGEGELEATSLKFETREECDEARDRVRTMLASPELPLHDLPELV